MALEVTLQLDVAQESRALKNEEGVKRTILKSIIAFEALEKTRK